MLDYVQDKYLIISRGITTQKSLTVINLPKLSADMLTSKRGRGQR